jgi:replication initiator protein RepSA
VPRGGFALAARHTLWVVIVTVDLPLTLNAGPAADHDRARQYDDDDDSGRGVLKLDDLTPEVSRLVVARLVSKNFGAWADTLARVGNCVRPVRLRGTSERIDAVTGEVLSSFSSADQPLGVVHVRCGNRRASECPSCSRLYAADMFHLIRAGVTGGKTVPGTVADHPLLFATLTAPSFGRVHTSGRCHPGDPTARCPHGRLTCCGVVHADGAEGRRSASLLGQPLCADCYDYASHVVWQWFAPDLWRRFAIALHRALAHHLCVPAHALAEVATVQYAKVAEFQRRGAVHFHALIRLDGPRTPTGVAQPPAGVTAELLAGMVREAASTVQLHVPAVDDQDSDRRLVFGRQLDVRVVRSHRPDDDQALTGAQVAGYLAKYSTKTATDDVATTSAHHRRLQATVADLHLRAQVAALGDDSSPYRLLGHWGRMLGFRGHFATKSRRYSITLGQLRRARQRAQARIAASRATGIPLDLASLEADLLADEEETTLVVGRWSYLGSGWADEGETALATAAAARAREYAQEKAAQRRTPTR